MKTSRISAALFGAALMCGSMVLAREVNKASIQTDQKLEVNGQTLKPGSYKVEWEGAGPDVQVKIMQGKTIVATVPAHVQQQNAQNPANAYGSTTGPNGNQELTAIYVGGKHDVLQFQTNGANPQQQSSNPGAK